MKGKVVVMMKRWWLTVLVFTLALSLTSCSKKKNDGNLMSGYGYSQCDDASMGSFDVYLFQSTKSPGFWELWVTPYQVNNAGDVASVSIINQSRSYKNLQTEVVLNPGEHIFAGLLTENDINTYDILFIAPPGPVYQNLQGATGVLCTINLPEGAGQ
jgi:hypothetical protein